jgi:hypothetical protein
MRIGGLLSDFLGEIRIEEPEIFENGFFGSGRLVAWKGGRFQLGYPLGMPLGVQAGIAFQVYSSGALCLATSETNAVVPVERDELNWFEVLGVATHLQGLDQSNVVEGSFGRKVRLAWSASASLDASAYRIYHDNRTGTIDYNTVAGEVDAKPGGVALERYAWTSGELRSGTWRFGIRAVDSAGNVRTSPAREAAVTLTATPDPPGMPACSYNPVTHAATLSWSPPANWI